MCNEQIKKINIDCILFLALLSLHFAGATERTQHAYVSAIPNDEYVIAARVLGRSLLESGTRKEMVLVITSSVSISSREALRTEGWSLLEVAPIPNPWSSDSSSPPTSLLKLQAFNLTQFERVVYLEHDVLVRQNIDHLFECTGFCVVTDRFDTCADEECKRRVWKFNTGVMSLQPSAGMLQDMIDNLMSVGATTGDHAFLNGYFYWWCLQGYPIRPEFPVSATSSFEHFPALEVDLLHYDKQFSRCQSLPRTYSYRLSQLGIFGVTPFAPPDMNQAFVVHYSNRWYKPWYWSVVPVHGWLLDWQLVGTRIIEPSLYPNALGAFGWLMAGIVLKFLVFALLWWCASRTLLILLDSLSQSLSSLLLRLYPTLSSTFSRIICPLRPSLFSLTPSASTSPFLSPTQQLELLHTIFSLFIVLCVSLLTHSHASSRIPASFHPVLGWALYLFHSSLRISVFWVIWAAVHFRVGYFTKRTETDRREREREPRDVREPELEMSRGGDMEMGGDMSDRTESGKGKRNGSWKGLMQESIGCVLEYPAVIVCTLLALLMIRYNGALLRTFCLLSAGVIALSTVVSSWAPVARSWFHLGRASCREI